LQIAKLKSIRDDFIGTAAGVTLAILLVITAGIAVCAAGLIAYDLVASYTGWGEKLAGHINLPGVEYLGYIVTALPTLIQMAYISARIADLPFARENKAFVWLYRGSVVVDTTLDIVQMSHGGPASWVASIFTAVCLFMFLSEFLFVFSVSVLVGLIIRIVDEPDILKVDATPSSGASRPKGSQRRG